MISSDWILGITIKYHRRTAESAMFRKLRDHAGTPTVSLARDELRMDGVIKDDGTIPDDQKMYINRLGEEAYLIRAVDGSEIPELHDLHVVE